MFRVMALPCILIAACQGDKAETGASELPTYSHTAEIAEMPTVVTVTWEAPRTGIGFVEYGLDGAFDQVTPDDGQNGKQHKRTLRGLKAGFTYDLRAVTVTPEGERQLSETTSITLDPPPIGVTQFTISSYDPDQTAPGGYVLTTLMQAEDAWVVIIDRDGDYVWYRRADDGLGVVTAHPIPDKDSIAWAQHDIKQQSDLGGILRMRFDGSDSVLTSAFQGHHDFAVLPNDRYAWISVDAKFVEIDGEEVLVAADSILETPEGSDASVAPREVFSLFTDYHPIFVPCSHFEETVAGVGGKDFSHGNSLVYDEALDQFRFMAKNLDNIMFVDREAGELLFEIGGAHSELSTANAEDMWSHGHYSQIWDDGFTVFDNAYHTEDNASRATEYRYNLEAGELELVWSYTSESGRFNALLGDVKRLGDTRLISWTESGMLTEVNEAGEVVWQAETELGTGLGRATWIADLYTLDVPGDF